MVTVQVERVGGLVVDQFRGLRGLPSQSRTLSGVEGMAIDTARPLGKDVDTVDVDVLSHADDVADLREAFRAAEEAQALASTMSRRLAKRIRAEGISVRDTATIMKLLPNGYRN